jgi:hypothetical protein
MKELDKDEYNTSLTIKNLEHALNSCKGLSSGPDYINYQMLKQLPLNVKEKLLNEYYRVWKRRNEPRPWCFRLLNPNCSTADVHIKLESGIQKPFRLKQFFLIALLDLEKTYDICCRHLD